MMGFTGNYLRNYLTSLLGRQPVRPLLFSFYLTHRCPLNCIYCSDGQGKPFKADPVDELNTAEIRKLFTLLRQAADTLDITGGEPLVREDLEVLLAHARSIGFRTVLNTKGIGLPDRPEVLESTDVLVLSIDSLRSDRLAGIIGCGGDIAQKILATLYWVVENRSRIKAKIVVAAVITPDYLEDAAEVLQYAFRNSLAFQFSPHLVGTTIHPRLSGCAQYTRLIDTIISAKTRGASVLGIPPYLNGVRGLSAFTCYPLLMPTIAPNGRMYYPCLEQGPATIDFRGVSSYHRTLGAARDRLGPLPACRDKCHIFCHMALSLLQQHPLAALKELKIWSSH
jgi:organic radical activating enzyme